MLKQSQTQDEMIGFSGSGGIPYREFTSQLDRISFGQKGHSSIDEFFDVKENQPYETPI